MLIPGVLSLLQMTILPGTVILRLLNLEPASSVQRAIYTFCMSLLANYGVNSVLFALDLYHPAAVWLLIVAEVLYLAFSRGGILGESRIEADVCTRASGVADVCSALALAALLVYGWIWLRDFGSVFSQWDDVVSWDRWAMGWFHHSVEGPGLYPQLMPANWSIAYQLTGNTDVKLFHKALMGLFPLVAILCLSDFDRFPIVPPGAGRLAGFVCAVLMVYVWNFDFILSGYVDIASSCFAIVSLYALFDWQAGLVHGIFPAALAAGCVVTKQGGIYILLVILVLMWLHARKKSRGVYSILAVAAVVLAVTLPYLIQIAPIVLGRQASNLPLLTQSLHQGRAYPQRWLYAWSQLTGVRGADYAWIVPTIAALVLLSVFHRLGRRVLLPVVLPYYAFWAFWFSYELRTLAIALPFSALAAACGFFVILQAMSALVARARSALQSATVRQRRTAMALLGAAGLAAFIVLFVPLDPDALLSPFLRRLRDIRYGGWVQAQAYLWIDGLLISCSVLIWRRAVARPAVLTLQPATLLAAFALFLVVLRAYGIGDDMLVRRQLDLQRQIGYKSLNEKLYGALRDGRLQGKIAGNYWHLSFLPDLKQHYVPLQIQPDFPAGWMRGWVAANPEVKFLIFPEEQWSAASRQQMLASGYRIIFVDTGFCLVAVS
jgi:hypothetical protein